LDCLIESFPSTPSRNDDHEDIVTEEVVAFRDEPGSSDSNVELETYCPIRQGRGSEVEEVEDYSVVIG
jgi:hypothetical protein